jgi:hypothetical protein
MKRTTTWLLAAALGAGLGGKALATGTESGHAGESSSSGQKHEKVTMDSLPKAARDAIHREAKGGKVEELRKVEDHNGVAVYGAEIVKNGKGTDIKVDDNGMVRERGKSHDESSEKRQK